MKVCVMTTAHSPTDTRIFHRQCKSLSAAGYSVTLVAPWDRSEVLEGIEIRALSKPTRRRSRFTRTAFQVYRVAREMDADVYHFHDPELIPGGLALRLHRKKVIYDSHENLPAVVAERKWIPAKWRWLLSLVVGWTEKFAARWFSAIVTADQKSGARLRTSNSHTVAIQNFPRVNDFHTEARTRLTNEDYYTVANLGGVRGDRAAREFVEALDLLSSPPQVKVIWAGVIYPESLIGDLRRLPGWSKVHYQGRLPRKRVVEILSESSVGVVLFGPEPNHFDVRSNRAFESMAAGLPILVSNFPNWRTFVEDNHCGIAVDPTDPASIAKGLEWLIHNPEEAQEMGRRGREAVLDRFSWEREEEKLLDLYRHLDTSSAINRRRGHGV